MIYNSPTNYSGSKAKIMLQLLEHFPNKEEVRTFYDVFAGGLSVSINTNYNKTISNDIISPLINFYRNIDSASKNGMIEEEISKILSYRIDKNSKEQYNDMRNKFNETMDPYIFFSIVCSSTNNMMRFNKKFKYNQTFGKRTINDNTVKKLRDYCNVLKDKNIEFTSHHFSNFFQIFSEKITKDDFIYLDPPYFGTEAGYNAIWSLSNESYLYDLLDFLNSKEIRFALSGVLRHKGIENPFLDRINKYKVINITHDYDKVARDKSIKDTQEILVINY